MLLTDEQYVIKWLSQYGALPKTQVVRLLRDKKPETAEKILRNLKRAGRISDVGGGYYLGLDELCKPDQRTILAVWVLLQFINSVDPMAHYLHLQRPVPDRLYRPLQGRGDGQGRLLFNLRLPAYLERDLFRTHLRQPPRG